MANRHDESKSRAEKVRARRHHRPKATPKVPLSGSATRKQKNQRVPVTRRPTTPLPAVTRRKNARYMPLKKKGAELQVPNMPRIEFGWRIISGAVFILSLAVIISFASLGTFQVSTIQLRGAQRLTVDNLLSELDLVGTSIIRVNPDQVRSTIEEHFHDLSAVSVSVGLPANITIQVVEREPVILWQQDSQTLWIDQEGVMFPVNGEEEVLQTVLAVGDPPSAPQVFTPEVDEDTGEISHLLEQSFPRTTEDFVRTVLSISNYIPDGIPLHYNAQFGLGWQDPQGWLVYFGRDTTNIDMKLAEYETIIGALAAENMTPTMISLEFLHAPYFRLEQ